MSSVNLFGAPEPSNQPKLGPAARFVRVVVERGIDAKGHDGLTYSDPTASLCVGDRVEVPLGKHNARAGGLVVAVGGLELLAGVRPEKIKAVLGKAVEGLDTRLPASLVDLATWMSEYYVCPLGLVLASMMPAAVKKGTGRRVERVLERVLDANLPPEASAILKSAWQAATATDPSIWPASESELRVHLALKSVRPIRMLLRAGMLRETQRVVIRDLRSAPDDEPDATSTALGLSSDAGLMLTSHQAVAIDGISSTLGTFSTHVLFGVTGSGKTEVYLRLIERVLARSQRAIVLVPEIALTPQTAGRFISQFGHTRVAAMHSGLTASQRNFEWRRACSGEADVVIGARSAIFAPIGRLGLIIVDEEHDSAYKQDSQPRYHGRDVAVKRSQLEDCPIVLGSATPSMESWWNATRQAAKYKLWRLPSRVPGMLMPDVQIVDMQEQRRVRVAAGDLRQRILGPRLESEIDKTLSAGGQVLLLLNRRGFARHIACPDPKCGFVLACQYCDASLVYHKGAELPRGGLVRCHLCLSEQILPTLCPACSKKLRTFGGGTQRAEEELEHAFASHAIQRGSSLLRVDSDTMRSGREFARALTRFGRGEVRILLGTQMIAKGLDFPNVRLVGILDADTAAALPDFRASERTFQLVSQVAGRAGRGRAPGVVLVQTWRPGDPAIRFAAEHNFEDFATLELHHRVKFALPPRTRLARVICRDRDARKAQLAAEKIAQAILSSDGSTASETGLKVRGPFEAPIARIASYYRWVVEISGANSAILQRALAQARQAGLLKSDAKTVVDVDPMSLL